MMNRAFALLILVFMLALVVSCKWLQGGATDEDLKSKLLLPFSSGVEGQTRWGYMDGTGKVIIKPQFSGADLFAEGRARVQANGKNCLCWGYIDETGKMAVEPQFQGSEYMLSRTDNFADGLAVVTVYNSGGKRVVIDKNGQVVFAVPEGHSVNNQFSEGLVAVNKVSYPSYYGFMDKTGKTVIEPLDFVGANDFHEGLAAVKVDKYGYIDKTGKMVIKDQFDYAQDFSEGLAAVEINGKRGFIDKNGQMVIEPQYTHAGGFNEGLAWVETTDGVERKFFYIDKSGKSAITLPKPKDYYNPSEFSEGLAWYGNDVIDKSGKTVFTMPNLPVADSRALFKLGFKDGVSIITDGKSQVFYVDKTGKEIKPKT